MRVLVVHATAARTVTSSTTASFESLLRSGFASHGFPDVAIESRHYSAIDPWVYEADMNEFSDDTAVTRFDRLDFVFIRGDAKLLPWSKASQKAVILMKMCFLTGKATFCCGYGAQLLAYVCATGGRMLTVINGRGRGSKLDDIATIPPPQDSDHPLAKLEVFLDCVSGDAFHYVKSRKAWVPMANIGMHLRATSAPAAYNPKGPSHKMLATVVVGKQHEVTCRVNTAALQHWSTKGLHREFVAPVYCKWRVDDKIIKARVPCFNVLATSVWGPMLFECSNLLGSVFDIAKKYPHTQSPLLNFIANKTALMRQFEHIDNSSRMLLPSQPRDTAGKPIVLPREGNDAPAAPQVRRGSHSRMTVGTEEGEVLDVAHNTAHATAFSVTARSHSAGLQRSSKQPYSRTTSRTGHRRAASSLSSTRGSAIAAAAGAAGAGSSHPDAAGQTPHMPSSSRPPRRSRPASARPVLYGASAASPASTARDAAAGDDARSRSSMGSHQRRHSLAPRWADDSERRTYGGHEAAPVGEPAFARSASRNSGRTSRQRQRPATAVARLQLGSARARRASTGSAMGSVMGGGAGLGAGAMVSPRPEATPRETADLCTPRTGKTFAADHGTQQDVLAATARTAGTTASKWRRRFSQADDGRIFSDTNPMSPARHTRAGLAAYAFSPRDADDAAGVPALLAERENKPETAAVKRVVVQSKNRRPFSLYKKFQKMQKREEKLQRTFVSIRNDGTPYVSDAQRRLREAKASRQKWVGPAFQSAVGNKARKPATCCVSAGAAYAPATLHKFRSEDPSKFLVPGGFKLA